MSPSTPITLSVDCMGGDHGPRVTLAACRRFLQTHPEARLLLVGQPQALASFVDARAQVVPATEVVAMDDPVEVALRKKKDSSMRVAIAQVRDGRAQAAVSAGNTGALMAMARFVLKTLPGISRPAIAAMWRASLKTSVMRVIAPPAAAPMPDDPIPSSPRPEKMSPIDGIQPVMDL